MKLEDIGFYTLSDKRAIEASPTSPLMRCEMVLTDRCNFNCLYCRGLRRDISGDLPFSEAERILSIWIEQGLRNVRFTGGEPCLYKKLPELVKFCRDSGVERIAISTNGSLPLDQYLHLVDCGVNDFSISLDGGCCSISDLMSGKTGSWSTVVQNIRALSKITYVTTGMVFTKENIDSCVESVLFAHSLGVADVRVIPAAQYDRALTMLKDLPKDILNQLPILRYRIDNIRKDISIRGLRDSTTCWLALDDMAVAKGGYHYPCIIYLREQGNPIGRVAENIREDRLAWIEAHYPEEDPICSQNCLDICRHYNKKAEKLNEWVQSR
jgi:MoaA/NifB/PqqE/SkfB family radical SAM enzyme